MTQPPDTLILSRREVVQLLDLDVCIDAVEHAFRLHASARAPAPVVVGMHADAGGFHVKAGLLTMNGSWFAAKVNANFPGNPERRGLPTIQGAVLLYDAESGALLAVMDSQALTVLRTAAATGVAARYLARTDSTTLGLVGCGAQASAQLAAVSRVRRLERAIVFDIDVGRARAFARDVSPAISIAVDIAPDVHTAAQAADILITCTPSRRAFLGPADVRPGTFVAAVGADNPEKQEIQPSLMAQVRVVTDLTAQASTMGDLHHAIASGLFTVNNVHAELGEIIIGVRPGRQTPEEIFVFDSTGMALQDVAAAVVVYEQAQKTHQGTTVRLAE